MNPLDESVRLRDWAEHNQASSKHTREETWRTVDRSWLIARQGQECRATARRLLEATRDLREEPPETM